VGRWNAQYLFDFEAFIGGEGGNVLLEAGMFKDATDRFRTALQLMPDSAEAHNNLGIALASQGELGAAIDQFQRALTLQPAFVDAQRNLAKLRGLKDQ